MSELPSAPAYERGPDEPEAAAAEEAPAAPQPEAPGLIHLEGEQAIIYLDMLRRLIRGGKPNTYYPMGLENLYRLMSPAASFGLDNKITLNPRNGMPSEPDIGRVLADKDASERFLARNDLPEIFQRTDEASQRLQKRLIYYRDVAKTSLPRRFSLETKLVNHNPASKRADFITIFERYDPGEGVFTRYTVALSHLHQRWNRPQIEMQGDDLQCTEEFRNIISRYHSDEAEFGFILLSEVPGIKANRVERGRVGPLWFKGAFMPVEVAALFEDRPGNFILNFPLERVETPSDSSSKPKPDLNCDPFGRFYRSSLPPDSRALADARAEELSYSVYKERKFCCTKGVYEPFKKLLADRGARCVIYAI